MSWSLPAPLVLVATRLFQRKGVQHVIEAMSRISAHAHELVVAGDGPQRAELERQAGDLRVPARFHGWLPRAALRQLYERSRIFVLASISDNFPVSLLEAMAAGCAIITTSAGGCPEVVGGTGLGRRAAQRVRDLFGWPAVASRHEAAYEAALRPLRAVHTVAAPA